MDARSQAARAAKSVLLAAFAAAATAVAAQEVIPDFYKGPGLDPNRTYVNQSFNEHIDPFNGSLQLHYVDIHIPGNGGLDLDVTRSYNSAAVSETAPNLHFGSLGVGWSLHFGRFLYKATTGPCGGLPSIDVLRNPTLELPDGSSQLMAASAAEPTSWVSTQRWRADCNASGVVVYSPDGVRYDMTQQVGIANGITAYYTTRITDRNGNYAAISYTQGASPEVARITTSDSRQVDISYLPLTTGELSRRIDAITSRDSTGDRAFYYRYQAIAGFAGSYQLTQVIRPDGTSWQYRYAGNLNASVPGSFLLTGVTVPQGGSITYGFGTSSSDYVYFDGVSNPMSRTTVVKSKTTDDGGTWSFSYTPGSFGVYDTTAVSTPKGPITYRHVGPNYATSGSLWMVGLLMQKQVDNYQNETYAWTGQVVSNQQYKRPGAWLATRFDPNVKAPLLSSRTIVRDGGTHVLNHTSFDSFGNPLQAVETGPNGGSRTTNLTWWQDATRWIIREPQNQRVVGGTEVTRTFDARGNVASVTKDGVSTAYLRNPDGTPQQVTYPRGLVHTYESYKRGIAQTERQPEGITLTRTVSDSGNVLSETNGRGYPTGYGYDGLNRLTRIAPPSGNPTSIAYTAASKTASRGSLSEVTQYDPFGRPSSITLAGIKRSYRHDALGRLVFASDPGVTTGTTYHYDPLDRVDIVTHVDNSSQLIAFGSGYKTTRDERGNWSTYRYRAYGNPDEKFLMSVAPPDSTANIDIGRDARDLVTSVTQGGFTRSYQYDTRGYLTQASHPETGLVRYGRDDANNMVARTVGSTGTATFGYDNQNRLVSAIYPGASPVLKTWTATNRLSAVSASAANRGFSYDANDNLIGETLSLDGRTFNLGYAYNANDQLASLTYPVSARVVSYSPDLLGRPTQVSGFVTAVQFWDSGQIGQIDYANGTTTNYGQNSRLWPSYFMTRKAGTSYVNSAYAYDGAGNLTSIGDSVDATWSRTLDYDTLNRLTVANGPWGNGSLRYDGAGNLRSQMLGGNGIQYFYDAANRLGSVTGWRQESYSYDDHGNIVDTGSRRFTYDGAPNLVCADCSNPAKAAQYQYDGLNNRVSTTRGGVKTYEFYAFNGNLLTEFTPSFSNRLTEHIHLGNRRIASVGPATTSLTLPGANLTAVAGQSTTIVATLGGAAPTGNVAFYDGSQAIGSAAIVAGTASFATTFQTAGAHTLTATYNGDRNNLGSSSTAVVSVLTPTTITGPTGAGLVAMSGKPTTLTVTINGATPSGTVSFYDGQVLLGTRTVSAGSASLTVTLSAPGTHTLTLTYSGDARNAPSTTTTRLLVTPTTAQLMPALQLLLD
jgi:YD repeat-containing protein